MSVAFAQSLKKANRTEKLRQKLTEYAGDEIATCRYECCGCATGRNSAGIVNKKKEGRANSGGNLSASV
jgi:hypothetical protein